MLKNLLNSFKGGKNNSPADKMTKALKIKILAAVSGGCATILMPIIIVAFVVIVLMSPLSTTKNVIHSANVAIYKFSDVLTNMLTLKGIGSSEKVYFDRIKTEKERYDDYPYRLDDFNYSLIGATIHYDSMIDHEKYQFLDFMGQTEDKNKDSKTKNTLVEEKLMIDYYKWAESELGYVNPPSLLIGALVGRKAMTVCTEREWGIFQLFVDLFRDAKIKLDTMAQVIFNTSSELAQFIIGDAFYEDYERAKKACGNSKNGECALIMDSFKIWRERREAELAVLGETIADYIDFSGVDPKMECPAGQYPKTDIYYYMNYDRYNKYLANYFIPTYFIECNDCVYQYLKRGTPEYQNRVNQITDDIYEYAQTWEDYFGGNLGLGKYTHSTPAFGEATVTNCADGSTFTTRTSNPLYDKGAYDVYWFSNRWLYNQCTFYAAGRANEILAQAGSPFRITHWRNAKHWCDDPNIVGGSGLSKGMEPKVGAIAVLKRTSNGSTLYGHVVVVEQVKQGPNGYIITVSEGNYGGSLFHMRDITEQELYNTYALDCYIYTVDC